MTLDELLVSIEKNREQQSSYTKMIEFIENELKQVQDSLRGEFDVLRDCPDALHSLNKITLSLNYLLIKFRNEYEKS